VIGTVIFPSLDDGLGINGFSIKTRNGTKNTEIWCRKNQVVCYVLQVVYLETLETTMGRMGIGEEKSMIFSPLHIGTKQDMYIGSEKLDTTRSNKSGVATKKQLPIFIIKNWL